MTIAKALTIADSDSDYNQFNIKAISALTICRSKQIGLFWTRLAVRPPKMYSA